MPNKKQSPVSDLESELPQRNPKRKKQNIFTQLINSVKSFTKKTTQRAPITFNIGLSLILFFSYISMLVVGLTSGITQPIFLLLIVLTLYIIIRYVKLERERDVQQQRR